MFTERVIVLFSPKTNSFPFFGAKNKQKQTKKREKRAVAQGPSLISTAVDNHDIMTTCQRSLSYIAGYD